MKGTGKLHNKAQQTDVPQTEQVYTTKRILREELNKVIFLRLY